MRLTITTKISLGLGLVVLLGVAAMAAVGSGLLAVSRSMEEMTDDKEPRSAAVYEMEINVNGFGLAVLNYQHRADPRFRAWAEKDEGDFSRFHALFMTLADTPNEWRLGDEIGRLFVKYRKTGHVLIRGRDRQKVLFGEISHDFEAMDALIDARIQPKLARAKARTRASLEAVLDLEADVAEMGLWLAQYRRTRTRDDRRALRQHERELRETLARFRALPVASDVAEASAELVRKLEHTMGLVESAVTIEDGIQRRSSTLIALRDAIDQLLDTELQVLSSANLSRPRREAAAATEQAVRTVRKVIPLFLLSAVVVALVMRAVLQPLATLMRGTRKVGAGDLGHRVHVRGNDELADLGRAFNRMVADLEATTVSKTRLEESERTLARTVEELRHEIGERKRASEERARLEASLRRSEVMSAMGALVAGVAHEVRNPLFGISSVVDALEARLTRSGQDAEVAPHLAVLRGEVDRLSRLMRDLLELGRPSAGELVPGAVADVVAEAMVLCAPLAERTGVTVLETPDGTGSDAPGVPPILVAMNRERLLQVFRNVVENAVQHSPAGGEIRIERSVVSATAPVVEYVIADSGDGIAADDMPRILEPFFSRRRGGTGLGLSIVQRIVEEHGGTVTAANRPGRGAAFVIRLPIASAPSSASVEAPS